MKCKVFLASLAIFLFSETVMAGVIQYMGTGREVPEIQVSFSRNNGASWTNKVVKHGQTLNIPPDATNLLINNVPYDPKAKYQVKDGHVFPAK